MTADYQFPIAQCDVPVERRPTLEAYRAKRSVSLHLHCTQIRSCYGGNAVSPPDGSCPSSAQRSIRRGDCACADRINFPSY